MSIVGLLGVPALSQRAVFLEFDLLSLLAAEATKSQFNAGSLILPALLVVMVVMIFRGQKRRQAAAVEVRSAVVEGAEVVTAGGQFGTVTAVEDGVVHLEVAPGIVVRYLVGAIARVTNSPALPEEDADESAAPQLES